MASAGTCSGRHAPLPHPSPSLNPAMMPAVLIHGRIQPSSSELAELLQHSRIFLASMTPVPLRASHLTPLYLAAWRAHAGAVLATFVS